VQALQTKIDVFQRERDRRTKRTETGQSDLSVKATADASTSTAANNIEDAAVQDRSSNKETDTTKLLVQQYQQEIRGLEHRLQSQQQLEIENLHLQQQLAQQIEEVNQLRARLALSEQARNAIQDTATKLINQTHQVCFLML
jgi:hypothetical protein